MRTFAARSGLRVTMDRYGHLFKSDDHKEGMDTIAADMFGYVTLLRGVVLDQSGSEPKTAQIFTSSAENLC